MESKLIKYLSKYVKITKELEIAINESSFIKIFPKGSLLLKEGERPKNFPRYQ